MQELRKLGIPLDSEGNPVPLVPSEIALATTYDTDISVSTEITFNASTDMIEVTAINAPIFMKWGTTDVTSSNWDHIIDAGSTRQFFTAFASKGSKTKQTAANFLQQATGAILGVAEF